MCCEDPPPDITFLGPPPKPPWLSSQLHCDGKGGIILQHEDQSSALPSSAKGISTCSEAANFTSPLTTSVTLGEDDFIPVTTDSELVTTLSGDSTLSSLNPSHDNNTDHVTSEDQSLHYQEQTEEGVSKSTLNIIAIVLFSLAAVFLVFAILILWYKRKLLKKPKIEHTDEIVEDYQYLYNFRIRGKVWKIPPRMAMMLKPKAYREKVTEPSHRDDIIHDKYAKDSSMGTLGSETSFIEPSRDSVCEVETCHPDHMTQIYMPYSSLDRRSSTTSGISSDGEVRSGAEYSGYHYNTEDSPYRVKPPTRRPRSRGRRYNTRQQTTEDGELGDVEGSVESLAEREKRYNKERQLQKTRYNDKTTCGLKPGRNLPRLKVTDDVSTVTKPPRSERPQSAVLVSSMVSGYKEAKGKVRKGILQVFNKPPKPEPAQRKSKTRGTEAAGDSDGSSGGDDREKNGERRSVEKKETTSENSKKKRKTRSHPGEGYYTAEKMENLENELRESNA